MIVRSRSFAALRMTRWAPLGMTLVAFPFVASAQAPHPLASWIGLDGSLGDERIAASFITRADPRWKQDEQGNLILRVGTGGPRKVLSCSLDHTQYVVSAITTDGYLRIHRGGTAAAHQLWDQAHQGQQVQIRTARGVVPGVVAIPNVHFARDHRADTLVVNAEQLWVDIGARSKAEAEAMGIALIDPVRRDVPPWTYGNFVGGADASGRVGCAAVASIAAADTSSEGNERVYIIATLRSFGSLGTSGALAHLDSIGTLTIAAPAVAARNTGPVNGQATRYNATQPVYGPIGSSNAMSVRARWIGTLVESVDTNDARVLRRELAKVQGVDDPAWLALDTILTMASRGSSRSDALDPLAGMLRRFADLPGVSGHEFRVRDAVMDALPQWARKKAEVDTAGNVFFSVGPARDTVVVVAHMDEVGYTVTGIRRDGTVTLAGSGTAPSAWEGQPALLQFPSEDGPVGAPLKGVFIPRDSAIARTPRGMTAFFGVDSAGLVARGVSVGDPVTIYKRGERLGPTRFTGRAMDDRAGTVALLRSLIGFDASKLDHTVIFAWSTREELGLNGAAALANTFGATVTRAYAIDTFVSSDTPLELPIYAYTPLGGGAVLRALDDGAMVPRAERERVISAAHAGKIALQVGTTHGSADALPFGRYGAATVGLSWPGRYSHSPAEVLDLRDLDALTRLIRAVVSMPTK